MKERKNKLLNIKTKTGPLFSIHTYPLHKYFCVTLTFIDKAELSGSGTLKAISSNDSRKLGLFS